MVSHPIPVLLIQLGPLGPKLDPSISRFDRSHSLDRSSVALDRCLYAAPASAVPPPTPRRQPFPLRVASPQAPRRHLIARHEGHQAYQYRRDFPGRVERLGVEVGYRKAETGGRLKAAGGRVHADRGWSEGIGGWEEEGTPVLAVHVGCVWGSGEDVVPF